MTDATARPGRPPAPLGVDSQDDVWWREDRPSDSVPDEGATGLDTGFVALPDRLGAWARRSLARVRADPGRAAEAALSLLVVALGTALVLRTLHPTAMWRNTTPTGGDMGSHVWGPRYLLDHLIPKGRLSGWSPDWYDGFPAYQFYMVVPSLLIVAVHVGLAWFLALPTVLAAGAATVTGWARPRLYPYRRLIAGVAAAVVVLAVPISYDRSFKLVTGLGLLGVPVACWALAKLADLPFPIAPLASVGGLLFIYNREPVYNNTGNIIGGNFASTMAGEFAFSISLTLAILYLGVVTRGLRTGRHRGLAAVLFALAGLCHLIPAFFVVACTATLFLIHPDRARLKWLATMVPVAGLLTAFWVLPFWWRRDFVNDMGWEKLPAVNGEQTSLRYYLFPDAMKWLLVAAAVGVVVSLVRRYTVGIVLAVAWAGSAVGFAVIPQYRLWNARILPFMYLSVALLGAIGVGEVLRVVGSLASGRADRPLRPITVIAGALVSAGVLLYVTLPLSGLFEGSEGPITRLAVTVPTSDGAGTETVTRSSLGPFETTAVNPVAGWSSWNYAGLQDKPAQPAGCDAPGSQVACTSGGWNEYRGVVSTMGALGKDPQHGCGRAFWEYDGDRLNGYGTPMALMMLPYFTDGCIGSQEGLYFESSTTVPYHFLMQSELSAQPSQPQRDLPYPGFDMAAGVRHLQLLGVKYYMAATEQAVTAASANADLTQVAVSGPWHVYQVADAPLVAPLAYEPVVAEGVGESQADWLPTASAWFLDPSRLDVPLAVDGPADWERVTARPVPTEDRKVVRYARDQLGLTGPIDQAPGAPRTPLPANRVSDIAESTDGISFRVSRPGVPVLVKTSYFPNWKVDGARGPYRVTPNLMVVVPTTEQVTMRYGRTPVDLLGAALTVLGVAGVIWLARRGPVAVEPYRQGRLSRRIDRLVTIGSEPRAPRSSAQSADRTPLAGWESPSSPDPPEAPVGDPDVESGPPIFSDEHPGEGSADPAPAPVLRRAQNADADAVVDAADEDR